MRLSTWCTAITCASALFLASCSTEPVNPDGTVGVFNIDNASIGDVIPGQYIVAIKVAPGVQGANAGIDDVVRAIASTHGINSKNILFVYKNVLIGFAAEMSAEQAAGLRKDDRVRFVEQDQVMGIPAVIMGKPGGGGGGGTTTQTTPWGITRVGGSASGVGQTAWIIDTGIDLDHQDLTVNTSAARVFGIRGTDGSTADDGNGHGTHVAGIIAAKNNTRGTIGVAAGATVVPVKVLSKSGTGSNSGVIAGVDYVAGAAADGEVANMSLGGSISTALDEAVADAGEAGVLMVLAAGNETDDANDHSPARVNGTNIYTVSATDINDNFASWSNYGNPPVDFAAPGVSILSLWKGNTTNTISGTSMAAPHVAGILTLGAVTSDGTANNDPDGDADPIAHR